MNRSRLRSRVVIEMVAARFRLLAEPLRVRLLQALQEGERNVSELAEELRASQPSVSKHLRLLQEAGIVGRRAEGNRVYYAVTDPSVFELCSMVCTSIGQRALRRPPPEGCSAAACAEIRAYSAPQTTSHRSKTL